MPCDLLFVLTLAGIAVVIALGLTMDAFVKSVLDNVGAELC